MVLAFCAAAVVASPATTTFASLVGFDGTDGASPYYGSLVQGLDGNLYGTTSGGGANGYGTVFKITPSGTLTTLYSFCSLTDCADGAYPYAGLVLGTDGNFYGTTSGLGVNAGTVFEITAGGTLTTLHSFDGTDGALPFAPLVQATNGDFYGTTEEAGANGVGTVFKITAGGMLTTLNTFGGSVSEYPYAGLVQGTDGNFYGTTSGGGTVTDCTLYGCGTVFKITPSGTLTTLYSFCSQTGCTDGYWPYAGLVQGTNGTFYGTTGDGGANGYGTVFKITPAGTLTTLYSFCSLGDCADGASLTAGWCKPPTGTSTGQLRQVGPTAMALSSRSPLRES